MKPGSAPSTATCASCPPIAARSPCLANYTYLAEPSTADKTDLIDMEEPNLINGLAAFSDSLLDPFLKQLAGGAP